MDKKDILMFYSKSKDVPAGKGVKEHVHDNYKELNEIKHWRRILSNFHMAPFIYNGREFNSIEHAFQAEKIRLVNEETARLFEINGGKKCCEENKESIIGNEDASIARKNRKLVILDAEMLSKWNNIKHKKMKEISIAKYSQCEEAMHTLRCTKNAELWHIIPRTSFSIRFKHLEEIREGNV
jgi:predicted NAD-dependent protein-ADP-ribosyltransferase YbiA (DUF1768 family)